MFGLLEEKCPICGEMTYAEGVHNGIAYVYPPLHCDNCGWSEYCSYQNEEDCKKCDQYEKCFNLTK